MQIETTDSDDAVVITSSSQPIGALSDGSFVLYDPAYVSTAPDLATTDVVPMKAILYGAGGLAIVGLAVAGGSGSSGESSSAVSSTPPPDGSLKLSSSTFFNTRAPVISGTGEPGAVVRLLIDFNRDNVADARYDVTVGSDFRWSVDLAKTTPVFGALPASGMPDNSTVIISSSGGAKPGSLPPISLVFDSTAPNAAVIAPITSDNRVNTPEKLAGVTVTGTAEADSSVTLTWGQSKQTVTTAANGQWRALFKTDEIPGDGATEITAVVTDRAGNASAASSARVTIDTSGPRLLVDPLTGDNVVNAAEAGNVGVTGVTEPGASVTVSWNGFSRPATIDENGGWRTSLLASRFRFQQSLAAASYRWPSRRPASTGTSRRSNFRSRSIGMRPQRQYFFRSPATIGSASMNATPVSQSPAPARSDPRSMSGSAT